MKSKTGTMGCVVKEKTFGPGVYFDVGYPVKAFYTRILLNTKSDCMDTKLKSITVEEICDGLFTMN